MVAARINFYKLAPPDEFSSCALQQDLQELTVYGQTQIN